MAAHPAHVKWSPSLVSHVRSLQSVMLPWPSPQDFFQILRPGLQLLRPPKRDAVDGPGVVAGFVAYNYDAFRAEFGIEPCQAKPLGP